MSEAGANRNAALIDKRFEVSLIQWFNRSTLEGLQNNLQVPGWEYRSALRGKPTDPMEISADDSRGSHHLYLHANKLGVDVLMVPAHHPEETIE